MYWQDKICTYLPQSSRFFTNWPTCQLTCSNSLFQITCPGLLTGPQTLLTHSHLHAYHTILPHVSFLFLCFYLLERSLPSWKDQEESILYNVINLSLPEPLTILSGSFLSCHLLSENCKLTEGRNFLFSSFIFNMVPGTMIDSKYMFVINTVRALPVSPLAAMGLYRDEKDRLFMSFRMKT